MTKDQLLLSVNKIKIEDADKPIKNKAELKEGMETVLRQRPNSNLLGVGIFPRYKLWKYNSRFKYYEANPTSEKIRERKVESPRIINPHSLRFSDTSLKYYMINKGYFDTQVRDTLIKQKNQEAKVEYIVTPGKRYFINKIENLIEEPKIARIVNRNLKKSHIQKGAAYRPSDLGREQTRIYQMLRNAGYYALKTENIWFYSDTMNRSSLKNILDNPLDFNPLKNKISTDSAGVSIHLSATRDSSYNVQYVMDRVYIKFKDPYHQYAAGSIREEMYKDLLFQYHKLPVHKHIIYSNIFIHPKDLYSTKNLEATHNRLNQLGTFQSVSIRFKKNPTVKSKLDCYIELTLAKKYDLKLNTEISNGEDYVLGAGAGVNYNTKNLFRGANKLNMQALYSIESRPKVQNELSKGLVLSANNFTASANLSLPRFLLPFKWKTSRKNTPFTIISLAYSRVDKIGSFRLTSTTAKLGYSWKETNKKSWVVSPMFLSYTRVPDDKLSAEFKKRIEASKYLTNTYSNNFIQGENINFEYRSDVTGKAPQFHTINLGFEEAGLLMQGINAIYKGITKDSISPIAHYMRADVDYRYYLIRKKYKWATRAMFGVGKPNFGDISLPYIKQYSQGGAYSNRGWQLRNLGPGRTLPDTTNGRQLVDRTGDIKLEFSTELRFPIVKIGPFNIEGAGFVDAGNIWLFNDDEDNVGGEIRFDEFWHDIAISSGVGLRLDFSFFVFRVDHAWRLKHPYKRSNDGWDLKGVKLNDGQWNVAIGYPF